MIFLLFIIKVQVKVNFNTLCLRLDITKQSMENISQK